MILQKPSAKLSRKQPDLNSQNSPFFTSTVIIFICHCLILMSELGVRLSGNAFSYIVWMSTLWGVQMPVLYIALRETRVRFAVVLGYLFLGKTLTLRKCWRAQ